MKGFPHVIKVVLFAVLALAPVGSARAQVDWVSSLAGPYGSGALKVESRPDGGMIAISTAAVFRSEDQGDTWFKTAGQPGGTLRDLVSTESGMLLVLADSGAFRSLDAGKSWTFSGLRDTDVRRLTALNDSTMVAASNDAVYRSEDGGQTWTQAAGEGLPLGDDVRKIVLAATPSGALLMSIQLETLTATIGIFRSEDGGEHWEGTTFDSQSEATAIAPSPDGASVYAGAAGTLFVGQAGLYRSDDDGHTWMRIRNDYVYGLHVDSDGDLFIGTGNGVYRSHDRGHTWVHVGLAGTLVDQIHTGSDVTVVASTVRRCQPALDPPIICHGSGAVYRIASDGEAVQVGLEVASVKSLALDSSGQLLAGTNSAVIPKTDAGWGVPALSYGGVEEMQLLDEGHILVALSETGVWALDDESGPLSLGLHCDGYTCGAGAVFQDTKGRILASITQQLYSGDGGVVRSTDSMATWQLVLDVNDVYAFAEGRGDTLYAGGEHGAFYVSADGGETWSAPTAGPPKDVFIHDLLADRNGRLNAATSGGIFELVRHDLWHAAGPPNVPAFALAKSVDDELLAATEEGVFIRDGDDWKPVAPGFDWPATFSIAVRDAGSTYVGTAEGVFELRRDDDAVRDTLDWHGYFPLEIGRRWQYDVEVTHDPFGTVGEWIEQWEIAADTILGGVQYMRMDVTCQTISAEPGLFDPGCDPHVSESFYLRYDEQGANILSRTTADDGSVVEDLFFDFGFRLDAPFYFEETRDGHVRYEYSRGDAPVIGGEVLGATTKDIAVYDAIPGGFTFAHDVGLISKSFIEGGGTTQTLRYARSDGAVYGELFPLGTHGRPAAATASILTYPNPAVDEMRIEITLPAPGEAVLELYDVLGRTIRRTEFGFLQTGAHRMENSARDLASGTYFAVLKVNGRIIARTDLVVIR